MKPPKCILAKEGSHSATVIFCHGLGDTSDGWFDVAQRWSSRFPHVKFVLPTAPVQPVTWNGGMKMTSWYDIIHLGDKTAPGIQNSAEIIKELIQTEQEKHQIPMNRIVLGGFSQGAALSIWTGLQSEHQFAGVIAMSGYLAGSEHFKISETGKYTPIFQCHGDSDPLVTLQMAELTREAIKNQRHQGDYDFKVYRNMAHSACVEEIGHISDFLAQVLPPVSNKPIEEMSIKELKEQLSMRNVDSSKFLYKEELIEALTNNS
jgi:lysophospholipase II